MRWICCTALRFSVGGILHFLQIYVFLRDLTENKMRPSRGGLILKTRAAVMEERPEADICPIAHPSLAVPRPLLRFNLPGYLSELRPIDLSCDQTQVS